jgi:hypothetical protein
MFDSPGALSALYKILTAYSSLEIFSFNISDIEIKSSLLMPHLN